MSEVNSGARRTEDIALDLLKFVAATTHVGTKATSGGVGFGVTASGKPEDQVTQLLDLYAKCRQAVEAPVK
jgi:hypothetical protein